jgi:ElaB/YqjD/DUF883 family membrane-anchored ribosome-binding protein
MRKRQETHEGFVARLENDLESARNLLSRVASDARSQAQRLRGDADTALERAKEIEQKFLSRNP